MAIPPHGHPASIQLLLPWQWCLSLSTRLAPLSLQAQAQHMFAAALPVCSLQTLGSMGMQHAEVTGGWKEGEDICVLTGLSC